MYHGERFNSISHLVGAVLALIGFGVLLTLSIQSRKPEVIVSFIIFGLTLVLLYTMSTLYHSFHPPSLKNIFRKLDHVTIYLLIAGTYTPYLAVSLGDSTGFWMLIIIWLLALIGLLIDVFSPRRLISLQIAIYLFMGWICVFRFSSFASVIPAPGMWLLTIGGIAYTMGVVFYLLDKMNRLPHAHGIWHLFVLVGSATHFASVAGYVR
jgi:hemolysin III